MSSVLEVITPEIKSSRLRAAGDRAKAESPARKPQVQPSTKACQTKQKTKENIKNGECSARKMNTYSGGAKVKAVAVKASFLIPPNACFGASYALPGDAGVDKMDVSLS